MKTFFGKKSRNTLTLVIIVSLTLHVVALLIFGAVKLADSIMERDVKVLRPAPVETPPEIEEEPPVNIKERNESSSPTRPPAFVVNDVSDLTIPPIDLVVNAEVSSVYNRGAGGVGSGNGIDDIRKMAIELSPTVFGDPTKTEGTLEATLIDLKRDSSGKQKNINRVKAIREFTDGSWNLSSLTRKYYSAKNKLYASYWIINNGSANRAPAAFGVEGEIEPSGIAALYQGTYSPTEDMRMRFCGMADDVLVVRLNNRMVLDASWVAGYSELDFNEDGPKISSVPKPIRNGKWINLKAGETYDLSILVAEIPGGSFCCYLLYQIEDDDKLRIFSTKPLTSSQKRTIREVHPAITDLLP